MYFFSVRDREGGGVLLWFIVGKRGLAKGAETQEGGTPPALGRGQLTKEGELLGRGGPTPMGNYGLLISKSLPFNVDKNTDEV